MVFLDRRGVTFAGESIFDDFRNDGNLCSVNPAPAATANKNVENGGVVRKGVVIASCYSGGRY